MAARLRGRYNREMLEERPLTYDHRAIERGLASALGSATDLPRRRRRPAPEILRPGDAAVPVGRSARRARQELHPRRRGRAHDAHARLQRHAPDGLGRVRLAGRERGDPARDRSRFVDALEHRQHAPPDQADGHRLRLDARVRDLRSGVLQVEPVVLLAHVRARAGLQARDAGQLVSARSDRAGQRASARRPLLALRASGRAPQPLAVELQDHRLRRSFAGRHRPARRLARTHQDDAAQLDRPQRRRHVLVRHRGRRRADRRLHHARRHRLRRDVHGGRARASGRRADSGRPPARQARASKRSPRRWRRSRNSNARS